MKLHKRGEQGEIATLLTIAVLLVIGATTFVSSLALKGKKTAETRASASSIGNCQTTGISTIGKKSSIKNSECTISESDGRFYRCSQGSLTEDLNDLCKFDNFTDKDKLFIAYFIKESDPENYPDIIKSIDDSSSRVAKPTNRPVKSPSKLLAGQTCDDYMNSTFCSKNCAKPKLCKAGGGSNSKRWCCPINEDPTASITLIPATPTTQPNINAPTPTKTWTKLVGTVLTPTPMMCNTLSGVDFHKDYMFVNYREVEGLQPCGLDVLADQRKIYGNTFHIYRECPVSASNECLYSCFKDNKSIDCRVEVTNRSKRNVLRIINSTKEPIYLTTIMLKKSWFYELENKTITYCDGDCLQNFSNIKQTAKRIDPNKMFSYDISESMDCPVNYLLPGVGEGGINYYNIEALVTYYKGTSQHEESQPIGETPLRGVDRCWKGAQIQFTIK